MFFEIYKKGNLIIRGKKILNTLSIDNELMVAPSCSLVLPIDYLKIIDGREEIKIFLDECRVFWGIVWDIEVDKESETIELDLRHVITEWQYRQISVNHAQQNKALNIVYIGDETTRSVNNDEVITASNFAITAKKIDKMTNADWIEKANAQAWKISNGEKVAITKVDKSKVKKENGTYKVIFSTAKGTSVTVDCEVKEEISYQNQKTKTNNAKTETIAATPFTVLTEVGLTAEQVKKRVKAKAWVYRHKEQEIPVTSITTNFQNVEGEYNVTASTANGTSITVKVKVESYGGGNPNVDPAIADKIEDIYNDMNFAYPGWQIDYQDGSSSRVVEYVYSRQNKLEALTRTMELTQDLWWRVGLWNEKRIEIGKFGDIKPYIISTKPSGESNIKLITEPKIDYDFEDVINVATVYSDKSDGGMSSLTLREVYMDEEWVRKGIIDKRIQNPKFPVVILHANVNNERDYTRYISQYPQLAPNNEIEYAVIDTESVALESGTIIEGTFSFNDLSPFEIDTKIISNPKRIEVAKTVYEAAIKKLIQARRSYDVKITTEPIPCDLEVGDRVRFLYDNKLWEQTECSSYWKKILTFNDYFYITKIEYEFDNIGNMVNHLTLSKWLKIDRETPDTLG